MSEAAIIAGVKRMIAEAVAAEREACAVIAENCEQDNYGQISQTIAETIRARALTASYPSTPPPFPHDADS